MQRGPMLDTLFAPPNLVLIAGLSHIVAYLIINQVTMRVLLLVGTVLYVWYYCVIADAPLWEAVYTSVAMGLANLAGLFLLTARKSRLALPPKHRDIYPLFDGLLPGDFRQLINLAERRVLTETLTLTYENQPLEKLYYVISGTLTVTKLGNQFRMPSEVFVGEVAYMTGQTASATTTLHDGAEILEWDVSLLQRQGAKNARFKMALESIISQDLAQKVSVAVAPATSEDLMASRPLKRGRLN